MTSIFTDIKVRAAIAAEVARKRSEKITLTVTVVGDRAMAPSDVAYELRDRVEARLPLEPTIEVWELSCEDQFDFCGSETALRLLFEILERDQPGSNSETFEEITGLA